MAEIAWLGTGVMGASMVKNLLNRGHHVSVYNRTYSKAQALKSSGAQPFETIAQTVLGKDFVFTMLGYPSDVEQVYFGQGGILDSAGRGAVLVDMTTSEPRLARKIFDAAKARDLEALDAPVSGGDTGAKNATLSIMVGGEKEAFDKAYPLFEALGTSIHLMGGAGFGQHTKACNQLCVAGATAAYTEAICYARAIGLDPDKMLDAIAGGAAGSWQIANMAPRALRGDYAPGFFVKHFIKDMRIAQSAAGEKGVDLPVLQSVLAQYEAMAQMGMQNMGTQALIAFYEAKKTEK